MIIKLDKHGKAVLLQWLKNGVLDTGDLPELDTDKLSLFADLLISSGTIPEETNGTTK